MEFYATNLLKRVILKKRFNSQRDGILLTPLPHFELIKRCFNSQRDGILPKENCKYLHPDNRFNSQRDGILQIAAQKELFVEIVSIPNGMEFYNTEKPNAADYIAFQFPTGWNSTLLAIDTRKRIR